ncbi:diguanylate cyclase [Aestuariibacter sp. AA17]|uniref:diguanylate cyclase n=2 Tax=Fluctibacter corallii TaxID=2984329 RepID=A0ABT3AAS6_9ALTE|nr:diguanylate cyclase [Aestuariibacter sp. AA17]
MGVGLFNITAAVLISMLTFACVGNAAPTQELAELEQALSQRQGNNVLPILEEIVEISSHPHPVYAKQYALRWVAAASQYASDTPQYAKALIKLATLQVGQANISDASANATRANNLSKKYGWQMAEVESLRLLGVIARYESHLDEALTLFEQAKLHAEKYNLPIERASSEYEISIIYFYQGKFNEAIRILKRILPTFASFYDTIKVGKTLNILGILYGSQSRYEESLEAHLQALEIARETEDASTEQALLNNIGVTYNRLDKYDEALKIYQDALALAKRINDTHSEGLALLNIAPLYRDAENYETAISYYQQGISIAEKLGDKNLQSQGLNGLAGLYYAKDDIPTAKALAQAALNLADEIGDNTVALNPRSHLARIALQEKDFAAALNYAQDALKIATQQEFSSEVSDMHFLLATIYEAQGNFQQALEAYKTYSSIKDDIFNDKSDKKIAALRAKNEAIQTEHKLEQLALAQELQNVEHKKEMEHQERIADAQIVQRNVIIVLVISLGWVAFLLHRRWLQRRLNKNLSKQVKHRTKQLAQKNEELQEAYEVMELRSQTDELTKLFNRRFLMQRLTNELQNLQQQSHTKRKTDMHQDYVFLMLDLDNFKQVNDTHGHTAGDIVLMELSKIMSQVFRGSDYLVRWGGEEFLVVMRHVNRHDASTYAERFRQAVATHPFHVSDDTTLHLTCSIGFTCYPLIPNNYSIANWSQVVDIADTCLYAAKRNKKDAWVGLEFSNTPDDPDLFKHIMSDTPKVLSYKETHLLTSIVTTQPLSWQ